MDKLHLNNCGGVNILSPDHTMMSWKVLVSRLLEIVKKPRFVRTAKVIQRWINFGPAKGAVSGGKK